MATYFAHSRNDRGQRQGLVEHLQAVSQLTGRFADAFGAGELGAWAGLWHDVGKFNPAFQEYLLRCESDPAAKGRGPDHKAAGAALAGSVAPPLALLMQGHHGGLHAPSDLKNWLAERQADPATGAALSLAKQVLPGLTPACPPTPPEGLTDSLSAEFFFRFLFSALVDADCLDTERHFDLTTSDLRGTTVKMTELWRRFAANQARYPTSGGGVVGRVRREVYQSCLDAASGPQGLYRLAVPTGGGKTLSGMAFALRHAIAHDLERIIVAVPFLSITEQTAGVYRSIFEGEAAGGEPVILEHHTGVMEDHVLPGEAAQTEDYRPASVWRRLAAQNWDAPIIITTTVQLFQSLFANRTSACRKLHNLARSVIILDEAQTLPPKLLEAILDALKRLCDQYGATVVLSTATQPAFDTIPLFAAVPTRDIVPQAAEHFAALKRVRYEWRHEPAISWDEVAELMRGEKAALAVVNTKKDALALLRALGDPKSLHLSTSLCGAHRRQAIAEVKARLSAGLPCRLVSTQVVEAGVDLDFPLVLRAMGPLDSIIQAAGRCNREGRMAAGRVIVFEPAEGGLPPGAYRTAVGVTKTLLASGAVDADDPAVSRAYFTRLFQTLSLDPREIQKLRAGLDYPAVAEQFHMIDDDGLTVVVAYGARKERARVQAALDHLRAGRHSRQIYAALQPYVVSLRAHEARRCGREGWIAPVTEGLGEWTGKYDDRLGLLTQDPDAGVWCV
jgi:CRISPR-associated endonuclease/helicase Cas3